MAAQYPDMVNLHARFYPQEPGDEDTLPCVELEGAQVYTYWTRGEGLCVSVDLKTAEVPEGVHVHADAEIPLRVAVDGETVFAVVPDRLGLVKKSTTYLVVVDDAVFYWRRRAWMPLRDVVHVVEESRDPGERQRQVGELEEACFDAQSPLSLLTVRAASQAEAAGLARLERLKALAGELGTTARQLLRYHQVPELPVPGDMVDLPGATPADKACAYVAQRNLAWRPDDGADAETWQLWYEQFVTVYENLRAQVIGHGCSRFEAVRVALEAKRDEHRRRRTPYRNSSTAVDAADVYPVMLDAASWTNTSFCDTPHGVLLVRHG